MFKNMQRTTQDSHFLKSKTPEWILNVISKQNQKLTWIQLSNSR